MNSIFSFPEVFLLVPVVFGIGFITYTWFYFIKSHFSYKKRSKKINEWSQLNNNLIIWLDEIDIKVKQEYILFCLDKLKLSNESIEVLSYEEMDKHISKSKQEVIEKYSKYIPSLRQEVRDQRINKILKS